MSPAVSRLARASALGLMLAGVALVGSRLGSAGDTAPKGKVTGKETDPAAPRKIKLFMLVKVQVDAAHPRVPQSHILLIFKDGLKVLKSASSEQDITIRPLAPQNYRALRELTTSLGTELESGADNKPAVRPLRLFDVGEKDKAQGYTEWELDLGATAYGLDKLELQYKGGKSDVLEPDRPKKPNSALRPVKQSPGKFVLQLPNDKSPEKFVVHVFKFGEKGVKALSPEPWPVEQQLYYVVVINSFDKDPAELMKVIRSDDKTGREGFKDVELGDRFTFLFAGLNADVGRPMTSFVGNEMIVNIPELDHRKTARVWLRFPLTRAQREVEERQLRSPDVNRESICTLIRKSNPKAAAGDLLDLGADTKPQWIEVPRSADWNGFTRRFKLSPDFASLLKTFPEIHRICVWEYDDPAPRSYSVINTEANQFQLFEAASIKEWPSEIGKKAAKQKK